MMHNCLVPYWELEEQDKKYDMETAFASIQVGEGWLKEGG
jgi:hypothetical protein